MLVYHILNLLYVGKYNNYNFHLGGVSDAVPVQIFTTNGFCSIHYWKKEIRTYINLTRYSRVLTQYKFTLRHYNSSASIVRGTRVFQPQSFLLDQNLCSIWYKMYACNITHHQRRKRIGTREIIARRTITITERKGTIGTVTATGTIPILYGRLITLILSNRTLPRK